MERLIAFAQAIARSLTEESIRSAAIAHVPMLASNRPTWALARSEGQWRPLMNAGDVAPAAQESAAKIALCEIDPPPGVEPEFTCFPMIIAGTPVGVLGVAAKPPLDDEQRRILTTAAALLAVSLKNAELFREVVESNVRDPLTACVTRRHGMGIFQTELRRARRSQLPMSLIVFDLDHFKAINDRYGHLAGDAALGAVGARMNAVLRGSDLKCRYGGEEFLILLPDTPAQGGHRVAETLRREIESNGIPWNDEMLRLTASFGITSITPGEMDPLSRHCPRGRSALSRETGRPELRPQRRRSRSAGLSAPSRSREERAAGPRDSRSMSKRAAQVTRTRPASNHSSTADQPYQEQHDGNHQQNPDKVAKRVPADHSQQPENDQNDRNGFEHAFVSSARPMAPAGS